jgi:hypothetical protein
MNRTGIDGLLDDVRAQRAFVETTVPAYARVLEELGRLLPGGVGDRIAAAWRGREFRAAYERPLLLLAAMRYMALRDGPRDPLYRAIAGEPPDVEAITAGAVEAAFDPNRGALFETLTTRAVQTNETSRAVAWLWPAGLLAAAGAPDAITIVDLGASAGLNLVGDELPMPWTDTAGAPVVPLPIPRVDARIGLDRAPLDVRDPDSALWLRACVWPGQVDRQQRLSVAIERFTTAAAGPDGPRLETCELVDAPDRLRRLAGGRRVLAFQTIVRDYLGGDERARYEAGMRAWLAERAPGTALWCTLELAGGAADAAASPDTSAAIVVHLADGAGTVRDIELGRCHPHPRVIAPNDAAVRAFAAAFA